MPVIKYFNYLKFNTRLLDFQSSGAGKYRLRLHLKNGEGNR